MIVKICGITRLDDALAAIAAGASALGFNFYPKSPRYIEPDRAAPILAALPAGVTRVGVFVNESGAAIAARLGLDVVQLHGSASALHGSASAPPGLRLWRAVAAGSPLDDPNAEAFLIDAPAGPQYGGAGRTFDWSLARDTGRRIILAGGLDASNVRQAIEIARPWGVDACSRLESAPGVKDHHRMAEFVKAALSASA
jgi:phosphoribosylanthranilate isomerase